MRKTYLSVLIGLAASAAVAGAQSSNPVTDALRAMVPGASSKFVGAAQEMPAGKYSYHPTKAQMTFGQLVLHVATSNEFMCSSISGQPAPKEAKLTPASPKAELVARVKRAFDFCETSFKDLKDSQLADQVPFFGGRKASRAAVVLDIAADWADHYGQAAGYLRLNGILPPTARRRGGM